MTRIAVLRSLAVGIALAACSISCYAISGNEQVELAGAGRYEELRQALEQDAAKGPLKTRDLHALCFAYSKTKRYKQLFSCLDRLAENVAAGDLPTRLFGLDDATPTVHLMRAEAHLDLANYPLASQEAQRALEWHKQEDSEDTDIELQALSILSISASLAGNREQAQQYASRLDAVSTFTIRGNGYVSAKAMAVAAANMALGNYQKTIDAIGQDRLFTVHAFLDRLVSGAIFTGKSNWVWQELPRAFMMNRALHGIGQTAQAKLGYDRLLALPQARDNGEIYWLILYERGRIAEAENKLDEAIEFFKKSIDVIERQRASIHTETSKIGFVGDKQQVYRRMIDALYAVKRPKEAFEYIERAKSRALVDMLAAKQAAALQSVSQKETVQLLQELDDAESELIAQVPVSTSEGKSSQRSIAMKTVEKIRTAAPELSTLISVSAIPISHLHKSLPPNETLIHYYYQGADLYASVYANADIRMLKLDASGLEEEIKKLRAAVDKQEEGAIALSQMLYKRLISPIENDIARAQGLLIIPHGALHYLPFSALHDGRKFLLEKYALRFLPSASVLEYLRPGRMKSTASMLVLGNPDLGDAKYDLPSAQTEAQKIAAQFGKTKLLLRGQATETSVKAGAGDYAVLHVASHGIFNTKKPLDSALLLSKDEHNDGKLTVGELYSMKLNADLVTLSACETGLGQINSGDDVVGLTRGFLYAGSSSVIASLWQVDDEATSQLMVKFYAELAAKPKVEALRSAQLEVKKKYPHPYFWSAFYLTGNAQ